MEIPWKTITESWLAVNRNISLYAAPGLSLAAGGILSRHFFFPGLAAQLTDFELGLLLALLTLFPVYLYSTRGKVVEVSLKYYKSWHKNGLIDLQTYTAATKRLTDWHLARIAPKGSDDSVSPEEQQISGQQTTPQLPKPSEDGEAHTGKSGRVPEPTLEKHRKGRRRSK